MAGLWLAIGNTVAGQEGSNRDWADRLEYVGVAVEEPGYHVWGSSPVIGPAGKTHLFVCLLYTSPSPRDS